MTLKRIDLSMESRLARRKGRKLASLLGTRKRATKDEKFVSTAYVWFFWPFMDLGLLLVETMKHTRRCFYKYGRMGTVVQYTSDYY